MTKCPKKASLSLIVYTYIPLSVAVTLAQAYAWPRAGALAVWLPPRPPSEQQLGIKEVRKYNKTISSTCTPLQRTAAVINTKKGYNKGKSRGFHQHAARRGRPPG